MTPAKKIAAVVAVAGALLFVARGVLLESVPMRRSPVVADDDDAAFVSSTTTTTTTRVAEVPVIISVGEQQRPSQEHEAPPGTEHHHHDPYNILFIKIPKVGGTTIAVILQRYAKQNGLVMARADPKTGTISTCNGLSSPSNARAWNDLRRRTSPSTMKFDVMAVHGCFQPSLMVNDRSAWNRPKRLLALTLLREPWSRFYSYYRFVERCCMLPTPLEWCRRDCGWAKTLDKFVDRHCSREHPDCSQMHYYLTGGSHLTSASQPNMKALTRAEAEKILAPFSLVMTTAKFSESLVLLHLDYGIPLETLVQIDANKNNDVPETKPDPEVQRRAMSALQPDVALFNTANALIEKRVREADPVAFANAMAKLDRLRAKVKTACADYFGKCITEGVDMVYGASCFHECTEAVVRGLPPPPVPECSVPTRGVKGTCDAERGFIKGCWSCVCQLDTGAAKCSPRKPSQCQSINLGGVCSREPISALASASASASASSSTTLPDVGGGDDVEADAESGGGGGDGVAAEAAAVDQDA